MRTENEVMSRGCVNVHNPLVNLQHLGNPGRREGGGCKAERGVAPERTSAVREDASPKRQRSKRPLSTDQGTRLPLDREWGVALTLEKFRSGHLIQSGRGSRPAEATATGSILKNGMLVLIPAPH